MIRSNQIPPKPSFEDSLLCVEEGGRGELLLEESWNVIEGCTIQIPRLTFSGVLKKFGGMARDGRFVDLFEAI
jgi:hypothetical protein